MIRTPAHSLEVALHRYTTAVVLFLFGAMVGCSMLITFAGGALGAGAGGAVGGPPGAVAGGGLGASSAHAWAENRDLRSGDLQGDGAAEKEIARLKELVVDARAAARAAEQGKGLFERSFDRLATWTKWGAGIIAGWLAVKYLFPWSRAAKNFWSGLLGLLRRGQRRAGLRKIVASTGLVHTMRPLA